MARIVQANRRATYRQIATVGTRLLNWTIEEWKNIVWSDESRLLLRHADGRVGIWRKQHESMDPSCLVSTIQASGGGVPPYNLQQLHYTIASTWTNVPVERFQLVESIPQRIQAVLDAKGGSDLVLNECT